VSARALFSSFLIALLLGSGVASTAAAAKAPVAKIALGAKQKKAAKKKHAAEKKKHAAKKKSTVKKAAKRSTGVRAPVAATSTVVAPAAPAQCANTELAPDAGDLELVRTAIVCLHNQARAQNGLRTLADNGALATAAAGHSNDMVARAYFDHSTPEGGTFDQRVLGAGYAAAGDGYSLGENLAWGTGQLATPAGLMASWMNSEHHRENVLKGDYRELGIGIALGTPTGAPGGATVTAEFGARG
jgi:uncharacterized protein YkwD